MLQKINQAWTDFCIVAAPGPSLSIEVAEKCRGFPVVAVNDAYKLFPFADVLYACDGAWWVCHDGVPGFAGEKWSSHSNAAYNNKIQVAARFGLSLVAGADLAGFSYDPRTIHYGENAGYQAVNLAIHKMGARGRIALVGFDMRMVDGKRHFFGEHPPGLRRTTTGYRKWPKHFAEAARGLPDGLEIVNCTPGSALTCFPMMDLDRAKINK